MSHVSQSLSTETATDPRWLLVQRIVASSHLRGSNRLRDFLLYVTECAVRNAPEEATEQQIGIHVFNRLAGYNSSEDSIVRTHARLLRQKLAAYFAAEGAAEDVIMEIPKGQYVPVFRAVAVKEQLPLPPDGADSKMATSAAAPVIQYGAPRNKVILPVVALLIFLAGALATWLFWPKPSAPSADLERLWHPFISEQPPLVIFSNALFLGDSTNGLRVVPPDQDHISTPGGNFVESYTGVGEVVAVHELTRLFDSFRSSFILKRSRLVTWDEAKSRNLIFIGAPSQNPALKVLPSTTDFAIVASTSSSGIVNLHPLSGEPGMYSRPDHPLTKDYAIVAFLPGAQPGKWMMALSGLTTVGSQAAAEFVCFPETAAELVHAATRADGKIHPFEAVLEVTVNGGVPVQTKLLVLHTH
jgi:hypothetical protein